LKDWDKRVKPEESYPAIKANLARKLSRVPAAIAFAFPPPAISGVGTAGGFTMVLEDRAGKDIPFLAANVAKFMEAVRKRPEIASINTTFLPAVPLLYVDVDRERSSSKEWTWRRFTRPSKRSWAGILSTISTGLGGNGRFMLKPKANTGLRPENLSLFYVRNHYGESIPMSSLTATKSISGPEFTMRYNLYRSAPAQWHGSPRL